MTQQKVLYFDGILIEPLVYMEYNNEVCHMADKVNHEGDVSALCYEKPRAINLDREIWTTDIDAVSCKRCFDKLARKQKP